MFFIIFILIILFFPFPIILSLKYKEKNLCVFFFGVKIYPNKKLKIKSKKKKPKKKLNTSFYITIFKTLFYKITTNPFKPYLHFNLNIYYGLNDAAKTAILNGVIRSFSPSLYQLFNLIFKTTKYNLNITPIFEKSTLRIEIKSIIFINIAKIIYMTLVILKALKTDISYNNLNKKEVV